MVIVGDNGVGKTTLIKTILGDLVPKSGKINLSKDIKIGYVPQFRNVSNDYPLSIADFVALNLTKTWHPWLNKDEKQKLRKILISTNLLKIKDQSLGRSSGGEKQRAYLAQALIKSPNLLILDESTASLDNQAKYDLLDLVKFLQKNGLSVIFITHDWNLAKHYGKHFLKLKSNKVEFGRIEDLSVY